MTGPARRRGCRPDCRWCGRGLCQDSATVVLAGRRVVAFAGIGVPEKFFATLAEAGAEVVRRMSFPDHHPSTARNLEALSFRPRRCARVW